LSDSNRERLAERLRAAREAAGLTQGQVARILDMHRPSISEIEAGRRRVSAEELKVFAETYGVMIEWLTESGPERRDPGNDRIMLAARKLAKMKDADLDRLIEVLNMLRNSR
jgi:transcriptional regulator with XRE-family HTH domain